jgi:proliferating cell nuclear antigen
VSFSAVVEADTLAAALDSVSVLVDECKIHLNADGLEIRAVDPANVGMVDMALNASAFAHYEADGGVIGVNLDRLEDVLGMADSDDMARLNLDEEARKLVIVIGGLEYTLALIDPDSIRQEPDIPDLELPATYVFEGDELGRAVTAADLVSDHIDIRAEDETQLVIAAEGDTDDVEVTVAEDDLLSGRLDGDRAESLFSLNYLKSMAGPIDGDTEVSLVAGNEMPLKLRYSMHEGDVSVTNMLAPRIQSE